MFEFIARAREKRTSCKAAAPFPAVSAGYSWRVPGGEVARLSQYVLEGGAHVMIAGNTRSGKSTLLHGIMADALKQYAPSEAGLVLLDPKRIELRRYKDLPHTVRYANDEDGAVSALRYVRAVMEKRYRELEQAELTADTPKYQGQRLYVVIDELIPLMIGPRKKEFVSLLMLLLSQAGAANIWFIVGTQAPKRSIIPGEVMLYFTLVIGLSMASAVESRCALGVKGCESLPLHGKAIVKYGPELMTATIPNTDLRSVAELVSYWTSASCKVA